MEWLDILSTALMSGGILYLLIDRFARTKEQRGSDEAKMVQQVSEAYSKTLDTVMKYSQDVIEKMRENDEREDLRHQQTERRCEALERQVREVAEDNETLKTIVNEAVNCKYLKTGNNKECPVITKNQKRLSARCRTAGCRPQEKEP